MPKTRKHKKQKVINMIGCSKKHKNSKSCKNKKSLANCPNCGPNCHCGPNCNCPHPCPGSCYLNRKMVKKGGSGCGPCGCPFGGLSYTSMNKFGGGYKYPDDFNAWASRDFSPGSPTYEKDIEDIPLKKQACIDKGYKFEMWIYNSKGERIK